MQLYKAMYICPSVYIWSFDSPIRKITDILELNRNKSIATLKQSETQNEESPMSDIR